MGDSAGMRAEAGDVLVGGDPGTLGGVLVFTHPQIRKFLLNIYLFGCAGSQWPHTGSLIFTVAREI